MIHPQVESFAKKTEQMDLYVRIAQMYDDPLLAKFIKLHLDLNCLALREICRTSKMDPGRMKKWAGDFLKGYDENIRAFRRSSDEAFEILQALRHGTFAKFAQEHPDQKPRMQDMLDVFSDRNGMLVGRIIFTYREAWFLAKHMADPGFGLVSVREHVAWADANLPNIGQLQDWLEAIHSKIN